MTDAPDEGLVRLVEIWHGACADFVALVRRIPEEQGDLSTDLEGWTVKDIVAHTAHLEAVLAGAPEETIEVAEAPHLKGLMNYYTEQGVLARRDRDLGSLADEIEQAVATRHAALLADPPTDGSARPPKTPGDIPWDTHRLLTNRPFDVWMHEQDIRRAIGQPGGYSSPAATHALSLLGQSLPMVVGKRVAPPVGTTVTVEVPDAGLAWTVRVGVDGRCVPVDITGDGTAASTTTVRLSPEDFVLLAGGRRTPDATQPKIEGDEELGHSLLQAMAVTP